MIIEQQINIIIICNTHTQKKRIYFNEISAKAMKISISYLILEFRNLINFSLPILFYIVLNRELLIRVFYSFRDDCQFLEC